MELTFPHRFTGKDLLFGINRIIITVITVIIKGNVLLVKRSEGVLVFTRTLDQENKLDFFSYEPPKTFIYLLRKDR